MNARSDPRTAPPFRKNNKKNRKNSKQLTPEQKVQSRIDRAINSALKQNLETKVCYDLIVDPAVSNVGVITAVTANLVRGDLPVNNFTGWIIKPESYRVRYVFSAGQPFTTVRLMVFQWLDASTPSPAGVLQTTGSVTAPLSPLNFSNIKKIRVRYDKVHTLKVRNTVGVDAHEFDTGYLTGFAPIQFAQSAAIADQMNGIYILHISDSAITLSNLTLESELLFSDA